MSNENISEQLRQSMENAMASAQERMSRPVPRAYAKSELRKELAEDNPIIVLERRFRRKDSIKRSGNTSPEAADNLQNILQDIQVLNRWVTRFGSKRGKWGK